jgi:hypothetical protein
VRELSRVAQIGPCAIHQVGASLLHRDALFHAGDSVERIGAPFLVRVARQREPEVDVPGKVAVGRQDPDDGVRHAVDAERLPDDVSVAAKARVPQPLANHDDARAVRLVFLGREAAAKCGAEPQNGREVVRDHEAVGAVGAGRISQVDARRRKERHRVEPARTLAPGMKVRVIDASEVEVPRRRTLVEVHEAVRLPEREGPEEEAVDDREHGSVRRDA